MFDTAPTGHTLRLLTTNNAYAGITVLEGGTVNVAKLANYTAHIQRVLARPAVQKVMADEGITMS